MDRRSFLKLLGAAAVGTIVPISEIAPSVVAGVSDAVAQWEKGGAIQIRKEFVPANQWGEFLHMLGDDLAEKAREALHPGTRFEIRQSIPHDFGRGLSLAWYATSSMQSDPEWQPYRVTVGGAYIPEGGYYLLAKDVA